MNEFEKTLEQSDRQFLVKMVVDAFHRIIFHYGAWFAEVRHQLGMEKAMEMERQVWDASLKNQMTRLAKTTGFSVEDGVPEVLSGMSEQSLVRLLRALGVNWLANDGIWFQTVEKSQGMFDAKRCNDTCWSRYSPFEANRIKDLLGLPDSGGLSALKKALGFRMYSLINTQSIEDVDDRAFIFYMNDCRVQAARKRKGLEDYPCKSAGVVEYPTFASQIDSRIVTECIGCPPDPHPEGWFCAWKFTLTDG